MSSIQVGVVMGSSSDWDTMQHAAQIPKDLGIPHEARQRFAEVGNRLVVAESLAPRAADAS